MWPHGNEDYGNKHTRSHHGGCAHAEMQYRGGVPCPLTLCPAVPTGTVPSHYSRQLASSWPSWQSWWPSQRLQLGIHFFGCWHSNSNRSQRPSWEGADVAVALARRKEFEDSLSMEYSGQLQSSTYVLGEDKAVGTASGTQRQKSG